MSKSRVLIVDDDSSARKTLSAVLGKLGYSVETAETGQEGLDKINGGGFDVVLLDLFLPDMTGLKVLANIKAKKLDLDVIILTGHATLDSAMEAVNIGATGYLNKPFEVPELVRFIDGIEEKRRLLREKREAEAALEMSERKFRSYVEQSGDGLIITDSEGRIVEWNLKATEFLGVGKSDVLGKPIGELYHLIDDEIDPEEWRRVWGSAPTSREEYSLSSYNMEMQIKTPDYTRTIEVKPFPIYSVEGLMIGRVVRDITWKKEMEVELVRSRKLESVGILSAGIAHDFNNLLTVILGNISLLEFALGSNHPEIGRVRSAKIAALSASELVQKFTVMSEAGNPIKKPCRIETIIDESLNLLTIGDDIKCHKSYENGLRGIMADRTQIRQVMVNVITNSIEAMKEGGKLEINAINLTVDPRHREHGISAEPGDYVQITVRDTGIGITPDNLDKVFDPYFSTKGMDSRKGTGLGLATAYSIVKRHDGYIRIDSTLGHGTTVTILLPAI